MSEAALQANPTLVSRNAQHPCPVCGNDRDIRSFHYPDFVYRSGAFEAPKWFAHDKYYCGNCQFLWTDAFDDMNLEQYGKKYVENNYAHQRRPTEARMAFAPKLLLKVACATGGTRFLDYGCGYNSPYIYELRVRGFDLWGCDISAAVNYSRYVRHLPTEPFPDEFFDGIYSIDVMEHLSKVEADFGSIWRMVKPGGIVLHNTIALENYLTDPDTPPTDPMVWAPWHCAVFSQKSAARIAEKTGYVFEGQIATQTDTGLAFVFRKPGPSTPALLRKYRSLLAARRIAAQFVYFNRNYTGRKIS